MTVLDHAKISRYNPGAVAKMLKSIQVGLSEHIGNYLHQKKKQTVGENIRNKSFLNVLSFPQGSTTQYTEEIKVAAEAKKFPPY